MFSCEIYKIFKNTCDWLLLHKVKFVLHWTKFQWHWCSLMIFLKQMKFTSCDMIHLDYVLAEKKVAYIAKLVRQSSSWCPNGRKCNHSDKQQYEKVLSFRVKKAVLYTLQLFYVISCLKSWFLATIRLRQAKLDFHLASSLFINLSRLDYAIIWVTYLSRVSAFRAWWTWVEIKLKRQQKT